MQISVAQTHCARGVGHYSENSNLGHPGTLLVRNFVGPVIRCTRYCINLLYVTFRKMPKICWSDFILVRNLVVELELYVELELLVADENFYNLRFSANLE